MVGSFGDAVIGLTKASLVSRLSDHKAISIHRLVQFTVFLKLTQKEKSTTLDYVISLLSSSFPNTWNQRTHHQGHGWTAWKTCSIVLPHVSRLITLTQEHSLIVVNPELFAELVFRAGT